MAPTRLRITVGTDNIRFKDSIQMDVMYLDGNPVLHIVEEVTKVITAQLLSKKYSKKNLGHFPEVLVDDIQSYTESNPG